MRANELKTIIKRRPFTPFRMVLVTGKEFEVKHPDQVVLSDQFIAYGIRESRAGSEEALFGYWIDLAHIVYVCRLQGINYDF